MKLSRILLGGAAVALPTLVSAQPVEGVYVSLGGGANWQQNNTISAPPGLRGVNPRYDTGYRAQAAVGYGLGNGFRVELEGNWMENGIRGAKGVTGAATGRDQKIGAFGNVLYDFGPTPLPFGLFGFIPSPYVGVGGGYINNKWDNVRVGNPTTGLLTVNNSRDGFGYQGIAGVSFPIYSVVPGLAFTVEYRFQSEPENRKFPALLTVGGVSSRQRIKVEDDFNHSVNVGLRYYFNTPDAPPPPAPVPVAAPAQTPTRTYLVFFDWDRSDLTARARQIIAEAAQNSTRVQYTRIEVDGHADRSGTARYNQALSLRRANAVAGELTRNGVPQSAIDVQAFGDTRPLVQTAAGVREPQNRRVEIIIK